MTKWIAGLGLSAALAFAAPTTAEAQGPIFTGGLVNVTLVNVANNNEIVKDVNIAIPVNAALNLAAQVCGVSVNVLSAQLFSPAGIAKCTSQQTGRAVTIVRQQ